MTKNQKKRLIIVLIVILIAAFVIQIVAEGFHEAGLYIAVGFIGGFVFIFLAKKIMAPALQREEDYYADPEEDNEQIGGEEHA